MRRIRMLGKGRLSVAFKIVGWLLRIMTGGTFVFSGFAKAIDPYGSFYKITDYVAAWGWELPESLLLAAAFILFTCEFVIGAMLVSGCFRRTSPLCATLVMLFMLPLSLWIAITNPVADCGCFGDAFIVSNWETFWKNIGLTGACVWLLFFNRRIHWLITPALQWVALTLSIAYPVYLGIAGYFVQPALDFRPYKTGVNILPDEESDSDDENAIRLIYRNLDGEEKSFMLDEALPEESEGWMFVRQESDTKLSHVKKPARVEMHIWNEDGDEDVTTRVLKKEGRQLILLMPELSDVNVRDSWPLNSLYGYCRENDIDMIGIAAATKEDIAAWEDISMCEYPVYVAEDTSIKEIVRGNPALVYLENGNIIWKQTLTSINVDELTHEGGDKNLLNIVTDTGKMLYNSSWTYIGLMVFLMLISFLPPGMHLSKKLSRKRRIAHRNNKIKKKA